MDIWIERFRNAENTKGMPNVVIPGDPERICEVDRMANGIPLNEKVVKDLQEVGKKFSLPF